MMNPNEIAKRIQALSPRNAFQHLNPNIWKLTVYPPDSLWEQDTKRLPRALQSYRRKMRDFALRVLEPHVLSEDLSPHGAGGKRVLDAAGKEGHLSDLLPYPFGSLPWRLIRFPIMLTQSLKMEELCRVCAGLGLMIGANSLGAMPILYSGDTKLIRRFVIPAFRKNLKEKPYIFAFAITEPDAGSDVEDTLGAAFYRPRTLAKKTEGGWILNGRKVFISGGDIADAVCVFAALEREDMSSWTCFLVEKSMNGVLVGRKEHKMGQKASAAAELIFEDVFVPNDHIVGNLRQGWAINRAVLNTSRVPVGAIALGIAQGALDCVEAFVQNVSLGGKKLFHYQDVQMKVAQMTLDTWAMRAVIWQAANTWTPTQARSSIAKVFCGDTAVRVCETAMEILGNHAVLHRNRIEKQFRDARLTQIYEGTNEINRLAIIEDLWTKFHYSQFSHESE